VLQTVIFLLQVGLQTILSFTVLSNCVFSSLNFDTAFLTDCTKYCSVFFKLLDRKFNEDSKNALKTIIFLLQADFTGDFVFDCLFGISNFDTTFLADCIKFCIVFFGYWKGNLIRIPKMCLKQPFSHSKWVLQVILSLTDLSNCIFGSSKFDTVFLPDCIKFCSVFSGYWIGNLIRIPKIYLKL